MKRSIKFMLVGTVVILVAITLYARFIPKHQCAAHRACDMCDRR